MCTRTYRRSSRIHGSGSVPRPLRRSATYLPSRCCACARVSCDVRARLRAPCMKGAAKGEGLRGALTQWRSVRSVVVGVCRISFGGCRRWLEILPIFGFWVRAPRARAHLPSDGCLTFSPRRCPINDDVITRVPPCDAAHHALCLPALAAAPLSPLRHQSHSS